MNSIRRISRTAIVLLATVSAVVGTFAVTAEASHLRGALGSAVYDPTAKTVTIRTELLQRNVCSKPQKHCEKWLQINLRMTH